ncbi:hypothetical protein PAXRUDRAFT_171476, partial [Paxillus rubicundulus Ve08.2h10]
SLLVHVTFALSHFCGYLFTIIPLRNSTLLTRCQAQGKETPSFASWLPWSLVIQKCHFQGRVCPSIYLLDVW